MVAEIPIIKSDSCTNMMTFTTKISSERMFGSKKRKKKKGGGENPNKNKTKVLIFLNKIFGIPLI